jgi:hypothetical protein
MAELDMDAAPVITTEPDAAQVTQESTQRRRVPKPISKVQKRKLKRETFLTSIAASAEKRLKRNNRGKQRRDDRQSTATPSLLELADSLPNLDEPLNKKGKSTLSLKQRVQLELRCSVLIFVTFDRFLQEN